jgi:excisionase family DNA binding protein
VDGLAAAADYAKVPTRTVRDWVAKGDLPAVRLGRRRIQIDLNDIDAMRVRIPAANGPGGAARLSRDDLRALAKEVAALAQEGDGGEEAGAGQ